MSVQDFERVELIHTRIEYRIDTPVKAVDVQALIGMAAENARACGLDVRDDTLRCSTRDDQFVVSFEVRGAAG